LGLLISRLVPSAIVLVFSLVVKRLGLHIYSPPNTSSISFIKFRFDALLDLLFLSTFEYYLKFYFKSTFKESNYLCFQGEIGALASARIHA
jgi:hypothetical protein